MGKRGKSATTSSDAGNRQALIGGSVALIVAAFVWRRFAAENALLSLRAHLVAEGANIQCVEPGHVRRPDGAYMRGLASTCHIKEGEEIVNVPGHLILSDQTCDPVIISLVDTQLFSGSSDAASTKNTDIVRRDLTLTAALLHELAKMNARPKAEGSAFAPFLAVLPDGDLLPENFPFWDKEQKDILAGVLGDLATWKDLAAGSLRKLIKSHPGLFGKASKAQQHRALSIAVSRQFGGSMVPWVDFANHASSASAAQDCNDQGCRLIALHALAPGDEVTIYYGAKANLNLLSGYGFHLGTANPISALSVDLDPGNTTGCEGARKVSLDHTTELALPAKVAECVEQAAGRRKLLEVTLAACEGISRQLKGGTSLLTAGRPSAEEALKRLEERVPERAVDAGLKLAVRTELETVKRCENGARAALDALAT